MSNTGDTPIVGVQGTVTALAVGGGEQDQGSLTRIFTELRWELELSSTIAQALDWLAHRAYPVVICEAKLPDGGWELLSRRAEILPTPPHIVVSSRLADERLWCEVLNLGGYDVLATPFERREVAHVVRCAWDSYQRRVQVIPTRKIQTEQRSSRSKPAKVLHSGGMWP